jgi:predicted amidophosphoribosyltransferase
MLIILGSLAWLSACAGLLSEMEDPRTPWLSNSPFPLFHRDRWLCFACDGVLTCSYGYCPKCGASAGHRSGCPHSDVVIDDYFPSPPRRYVRSTPFARSVLNYPDWRSYSVSVPLWFLCLALGAYPTVAFVRGPLRRRRRRKRGLCVNCAYDLTGNVSGICPECGARVELVPG